MNARCAGETEIIPLRTRAIPERLRGVFTIRRYTNPHLHYLIQLQHSPEVPRRVSGDSLLIQVKVINGTLCRLLNYM